MNDYLRKSLMSQHYGRPIFAYLRKCKMNQHPSLPCSFSHTYCKVSLDPRLELSQLLSKSVLTKRTQ